MFNVDFGGRATVCVGLGLKLRWGLFWEFRSESSVFAKLKIFEGHAIITTFG